MDPATAIGTPRIYRGPCSKLRPPLPGRNGKIGTGPTLNRAGPAMKARGATQPKESPQAQELPALGLSMVNPCFSMESAKSIVAPSR